jgi:hypothetical protein
MSDIVLRGTLVNLDSDIGHAFVVDCVRAGEGILSDRELSEIWELDPPAWRAIMKDRDLERAIRTVRQQRVRSGAAAQEAAQKHFVKAPTILAGIMENESANPRHVIEAAKEIRTVASGGSSGDRPAETERFVIRIDLSADGTGHIETYDKPMKIDVSDGDGPDNLLPLKGKPDDVDDQR